MIASIGNQRRGNPGLITEYEVGSPLKIVDWQEMGVGPIYPRKAKALRFQPRGRSYFIFVKSTKGIPEHRFIRAALRQLTARDCIPGLNEALQ